MDDFSDVAAQVFSGVEVGGFCPDGGWWGNVRVDQWWVIEIECDHGTYKGVSRGPFDAITALTSAIENAKQAHKESNEHRHAEEGSNCEPDQGDAGEPGQGQRSG